MGRIIFLLCCFILLSLKGESEWQSMDWIAGRIMAITVKEGEIYVLSSRFIYRLAPQIGWRKICRVRGGEDLVLNDIKVGNEFVYWTTNIGLFRVSRLGGRAERIFYPEGGLMGLDVVGDSVFVGGKRAVYEIVGGRVNLLFRTQDACAVKFLPGKDLLLILSRNGLVFWKVSEKKKIKVIPSPQGEDFYPVPRGIGWLRGEIYVLSRSSVFRIADGAFQFVFDYPGKAKGFLSFGDRLLVYGDNGLYDIVSGERVNDGLEDQNIISGSGWRGVVVVSSPYKIYRWKDIVFDGFRTDSMRMKFLWRVFSWEPSVLDLQREAMKYADVLPEKIVDWKRRLKKRALFPKFTVDMDVGSSRSVSDSVAVSSYGAENVGPDDKTVYGSFNFGVSLEWDLRDWVWSDKEISIDTRSKLTVELRDDILDQVDQLYFERRRLIMRFILNPPSDKKDLLELFNRIRHLRADLDGLTGGYLTQALSRVGKEDWEKRWLLTIMEGKGE